MLISPPLQQDSAAARRAPPGAIVRQAGAEEAGSSKQGTRGGGAESRSREGEVEGKSATGSSSNAVERVVAAHDSVKDKVDAAKQEAEAKKEDAQRGAEVMRGAAAEVGAAEGVERAVSTGADVVMNVMGNLLDIAKGLPFAEPVVTSIQLILKAVKDVHVNRSACEALKTRAEALALLMKRTLPLFWPGGDKTDEWADANISAWFAQY